MSYAKNEIIEYASDSRNYKPQEILTTGLLPIFISVPCKKMQDLIAEQEFYLYIDIFGKNNFLEIFKFRLYITKRKYVFLKQIDISKKIITQCNNSYINFLY